jgi:hypothetical protein
MLDSLVLRLEHRLRGEYRLFTWEDGLQTGQNAIHDRIHSHSLGVAFPRYRDWG